MLLIELESLSSYFLRLILSNCNVIISYYKEQKQKTIFLDLDKTLIYSNDQLKYPDAELFSRNSSIKLNVRPYCYQFLKRVNENFNIFIFTSATKSYAELIVKYLNQNNKLIKGILHRDHCLKTKNGRYIKDLRIIKNINLKQTIIIDNNIHSFSFNLNNGIPI